MDPSVYPPSLQGLQLRQPSTQHAALPRSGASPASALPALSRLAACALACLLLLRYATPLWRLLCALARALARACQPAAPAPAASLPPAAAPRVPLVMVVNARSGNGQGHAVAETVRELLRRGDRTVAEVLPLSVDGLAAALRRVRELLPPGAAPASPSSSSSSHAAAAAAAPLPVRLVCAGGDGTVSAVAGVLAGCGLSGVPIAVLPLGTGNDMARSLGMGGAPPPITPAALAPWLRRCAAAPTRACDVWSVSFAVHPGGSIRVLRHGVETALPEAAVKGSGVLYVSAGLDAQLVWEVERRRSGSRWANRALYALLGGGLVVGGAWEQAWWWAGRAWRAVRGGGGGSGARAAGGGPPFPPFSHFFSSYFSSSCCF
jgi:diacylglycerol kinase family enzyme